MIQILPVASPLHGATLRQAVAGSLMAQLARLGVPAKVVEDGERPASREPTVLMVVTGGTEHLALEALEHVAGPAILLAHPDHNSLPAALEILARLRQLGRRGKVVLLNGRAEGLTELVQLLAGMTAWDRLQRLRLGRVGMPSDWLVASSPDPALVQEVWGPTVVDVPLAELVEGLRSVSNLEADSAARDQRARAAECVEPSAAELRDAARVTLALRRLVARHRLDAFTLRCFELVTELRTTGCMAVSQLLEDGVMAGCEGDVPATLTMAWLHACTGQVPFMANPQDLEVGSHALWLAHCTVARSAVETHRLRSHFESSLGVGIEGRWRPGPVTVARVGGADLRELWVTNGEVVENGTSAHRCRTQIKVVVQEDLRGLLERPLGNHHVVVNGHWAEKLRAHHALHVAR